jgi:hypothetical protein
MPGFDAAVGTVTVPIWAAGAASALFVVAVVLAIGRAGATALINTLFRIAVVVLAVYGGWVYLQRAALTDRVAERRSLDERSVALMARAIAPGSALSCLDELAGETVEAACEKAVFASPEAVAAAVSYVTAKLALLSDGNEHARRVDAAYAAELAPLRGALELDRFGIVAHVLAERDGCNVEKCDALIRFRDQSHVLANLRDQTFEEHVTKSTAIWNAPRPPEGPTVAAAPAPAPPPPGPTAPLPQNLGPAPATVAPRYDFPSAQSIPPVNIMAAEPPAPRAGAATTGQQAPGEGNAQAAVTPVPPRRPPQVRVAPNPSAPRQPGQPQAAPTAVGEAPTDGAVPRPSAPVVPR